MLPLTISARIRIRAMTTTATETVKRTTEDHQIA
jgi:hypothetical protein